MAWRVDEFVIRGEIDNRTRGRVTGRIWFSGRDKPVELDLAGNAWRDLAGRQLGFVNPEPRSGALAGLATRQCGVIGDCTASRKVKVPDIPPGQIGEYHAAGIKWTWHWGNSLCLEWFSEGNGRVVIESAGFQLTVSPETAWDMTVAEEEEQRRANAGAMAAFMERLGPAGDDGTAPPEESGNDVANPDSSAAGGSAEDPAEWSVEPLTEEEAERMHEESERLIDRIHARMEREGDGANFEQILQEELERRRRERGEPPLTPEQEAGRDEQIEEMNRARREAEGSMNPDLDAKLEQKHPLAVRAYELTLRLMREPEARGWIPPDAMEEHPLIDLAAACSKAAAKLAGALNGDDWPPAVDFCANIIVRLKRARGYADDALRAADSCLELGLAERGWLLAARGELSAVAQECDALIADLRALLQRGFE